MCSHKHHFQIAALMAILVLFLTVEQAAAQHETILYNGTGSAATLTFDASGNLYGTNSTSIFELSPSGLTWTENTLYATNGGLQNLEGTPVFGPGGNIYSVSQGGRGENFVFELLPSGGGKRGLRQRSTRFLTPARMDISPTALPPSIALEISSAPLTLAELTAPPIPGAPCTN